MQSEVEIFLNERQKLYEKFADKLEIAPHFNRQLVSFQANKEEPVYRLFKYKEGFSSSLVQYFLSKYFNKPGKVLDPFAGVGTTLFAGQELGWKSYGVELLPVGIFVLEARQALQNVDYKEFKKISMGIWDDLRKFDTTEVFFHHIPITKDAFPEETETSLNKFLAYCNTLENKDIQTVLRFVAFSVLEEISYTRKDGQYLRWDYRSKRELGGKSFNKGKILSFDEAVKRKLSQMLLDLSPINDSLFEKHNGNGQRNNSINIVRGSCLEELPRLQNEFFDFIITSPPYCNRYDYTRTYALELVFLGNDSESVRTLRQQLLSCTVENKEKIDQLEKMYTALHRKNIFEDILNVYNGSEAMREVNFILGELNNQEKLNNNNIPRMVKNYFLELCFVIYEMARVTKCGGYCVMINDNVRYGGEEIPVDLILSEFAEAFGFDIQKIFVLPKGKGNSSQQMGSYGRTEVRKCVYLWQKR